MWGLNADGDHDVERYEYQRSGALAVQEFAPGNSFYAGGHRHVIDALEIGTADNLFEEWRICPDCGHAEIVNDTVGACPRCGAAAFADVGAKHQLLQPRTARAASSKKPPGSTTKPTNAAESATASSPPSTLTPPTSPVHGNSTSGHSVPNSAATPTSDASTSGAATDPENTPVAGRDINAKFTVCSECGAERDAETT